jgi:cyclic-di-GMP-binding protein
MSTPPTATRPGSLPYADARGCKEWLGSLPLTNIPQAQALVLESLRALNGAEMDGLARLKCMELLRDKVAFLQGEQRVRYFGKTLPLSANDSAAWSTGRTLLDEMESGYRRCLAASRTEGGEIATHGALVTQRIVRFVGAQMWFHAIVYRRFDPRLWLRLHEELAAAERAGIVAEAVKDSMEGEDGSSSIHEAYAQVVLQQAAYLSELTAPQMDFVEALLRAWARRVPLRPAGGEPPASGMHALAVDLERDIGARPLTHAEARASHRVLDTEQLSRSLRKRIHALQNDEDPATLGLPPLGSAAEMLALLKRLHRLWCEGAPPRPPAKVPAEPTVGLAFGLTEIGFFVTGGKVFEQPDRKREMTRQEKQDIEVFGRVTERTQTMMLSEHNFTVESWGVVDEMMGAWRLQRPPTASKGVGIGRLVAMRVGAAGQFFLGMLSALSQETDGRLVVTVTLFPGKPESIPVRAADARNRANPQWSQGFRLPALERINIPQSLVVPSGVAARGRGIEVWADGPRESTVYEILERGTDFDRITVF